MKARQVLAKLILDPTMTPIMIIGAAVEFAINHGNIRERAFAERVDNIIKSGGANQS